MGRTWESKVSWGPLKLQIWPLGRCGGILRCQIFHKHAVPAPFLAWLTQDGDNPDSRNLLDAMQWAVIWAEPTDWDSWLPDWHLPCARTSAENVEINDMPSLSSQALLSSWRDTWGNRHGVCTVATYVNHCINLGHNLKSGCPRVYFPD